MNYRHLEENISSLARTHSSARLASESAITVLNDLFALLEEYGPGWYTEELHNRTEAVLHQAAREQLLHR